MSGLAAAPYAVKKNVKDGMEKHNAHLAKIQSSLGCEPIKFEFDFESLSAALIEAQYTLEQFSQVFFLDYFEEIANGIQSKVEADSMLPAIVCAMMPSNIIRLVIGGAENEEHKYHSVVFTNGEMVVHIVRLGYNQSVIMDTMMESLTESGMPYAIAKNIRDNIPKRDAHLAQIGAILKRDPFTLDVSFETMKPHMEKDGHPLARFGDIFLDDYLAEFATSLNAQISADPDMIEPINEKVTTSVMSIKLDPEAESGYNWVKLEDGQMNIRFAPGRTWCNMSSVCDKLVQEI